jgi:hypothetical protein
MQLIREILALVETAKVGKCAGDKLDKPGKDEKVLGVLPEELQRFHVVIEGMCDKARKELEALIAAEPSPKCEGDGKCLLCSNEAVATHKNHVETAREMFWGAVRRAIPGALTKSIGLRKGFQVVICSPKEQEDEVIAMRLPHLVGLAAMLSALRMRSR